MHKFGRSINLRLIRKTKNSLDVSVFQRVEVIMIIYMDEQRSGVQDDLVGIYITRSRLWAVNFIRR